MNSILEINTKNIIHNLEYIKQENPNKKICIPVKANGYGLGYDITDHLIKKGFDFFGVSTLQEALYIRGKHKEAKIILFSAIFKEDLDIVKINDIIITVYDFNILKNLTNDIKFHLKFDIGMGRLGFFESDTNEIKNILKEKNLSPQGIYSHLSQSYNEDVTLNQIKLFENIVEHFKSFKIEYIHLLNGVGCLKYKTKFDNLIRPGLITFGYFEKLSLKNQLGNNIKPSLSLKTKISHIKDYNGLIGYDGDENVKGRVATLPIGYHDGLKQSYNGFEIKNVGKFVGKICMCQSMVLLNEDANFKKGDWIYIFKQDDNQIYNLAKHSGVSIYEILVTMSNRIKREYN